MRKILVLTILVSVLLSACAAAANPAPGLPTPTGAAGPTRTTGLSSAPPTSAPGEAAALPDTPAPAPTVAVKTDFTPTDPTTVNLAAGKPQFVEFFAFW
jgi:hypothetical protein